MHRVPDSDHVHVEIPQELRHALPAMRRIFGPESKNLKTRGLHITRSNGLLCIETISTSVHTVRCETPDNADLEICTTFPFHAIDTALDFGQNQYLTRIQPGTWVLDSGRRIVINGSDEKLPKRTTQLKNSCEIRITTDSFVAGLRAITSFEPTADIQLRFFGSHLEVVASTPKELIVRNFQYHKKPPRGVQRGIVVDRTFARAICNLQGADYIEVGTDGLICTVRCGNTIVEGPIRPNKTATEWRPSNPWDFPYDVEIERNTLRAALTRLITPKKTETVEISREGQRLVLRSGKQEESLPLLRSSDLFDEVVLNLSIIRASTGSMHEKTIRLRTSHNHNCVLIGTDDVNITYGDAIILTAIAGE